DVGPQIGGLRLGRLEGRQCGASKHQVAGAINPFCQYEFAIGGVGQNPREAWTRDGRMSKITAAEESTHWAEGSVKNRVGRINCTGGATVVADTQSDAEAHADGKIVEEVRGRIQEEASAVCNPIRQGGQVVKQ